MLLLLMLGMLEVMVVLVVLKELIVFVGGIFERVKSQNSFLGKIIESKNTIFGAKKRSKNRQSQKSTFTLESYIALRGGHRRNFSPAIGEYRFFPLLNIYWWTSVDFEQNILIV